MEHAALIYFISIPLGHNKSPLRHGSRFDIASSFVLSILVLDSSVSTDSIHSILFLPFISILHHSLQFFHFSILLIILIYIINYIFGSVIQVESDVSFIVFGHWVLKLAATQRDYPVFLAACFILPCWD